MPNPEPPTPNPALMIPSQRAQELIRAATAELLRDPAALFEAVDASVLATQPRPTRHDRELAEAIRASSRSNLTHWATQNLQAPGFPVPLNPAPEPLALAKLIALRGLSDTSQAAYVAGQNATWPFWMRAVFSLTSDAEELREVLDVSARSIFAFVDAMVAVLHDAIERERRQALSSANSRRLTVVRELLERTPVSAGRAEQELGYPIDIFNHTAVVIWGTSNRRDVLAGMAEALADSVRPRLRRRPLTVMPNPDMVWAWFPSGSTDVDLDVELRERADPPDGIWVSIGGTESGYHGFQTTHRDARLTHRLMQAGDPETRVASYVEVSLAALASEHPDRARRYVQHRLGALPIAGPEVVETLRAYLQHRCSPSRTARATFTHRNTVIDRIRRAEELLPQPIEGNETELAVALELSRWRWGDVIRDIPQSAVSGSRGSPAG